MAVARERVGFSHGDLHCGNILVRTFDEPVIFRYQFANGSSYAIESRDMVTIIDFGRGHILAPLKPRGRWSLEEETLYKSVIGSSTASYLISPDQEERICVGTGQNRIAIGVSPINKTTLYDMCLLLASASSYARIGHWMSPLFNGRTQAFNDYAANNWWADYWGIAPFGVDIDPRELFEASLPLWEPSNRPAVRTSQLRQSLFIRPMQWEMAAEGSLPLVPDVPAAPVMIMSSNQVQQSIDILLQQVQDILHPRQKTDHTLSSVVDYYILIERLIQLVHVLDPEDDVIEGKNPKTGASINLMQLTSQSTVSLLNAVERNIR